jgi:CheY-like chemotaxis protein
LLLEDRDDFQKVLRDYYLTACSYRVISVGSGIEGLREIMNARFDLIICDMMMPRMAGEMFYWAPEQPFGSPKAPHLRVGLEIVD